MPTRTAARTKTAPISPYLTVKGAADAIAFYQKAFGAKEKSRMPAQDGKRLMHADVTINGGTVLLCDEFPEYGGPGAPTNGGGSPVAITIQYAKPAEVDATFQRALSAGAKSVQEPQDMFWDARFAMLTDPFGHRWFLNAPLPKKPAPKKKAAAKKR
ncbi:MAG TPA: VOC family protein [Hyphomicrobiaceae bacterium]|jgi:PhnB protein